MSAHDCQDSLRGLIFGTTRRTLYRLSNRRPVRSKDYLMRLADTPSTKPASSPRGAGTGQRFLRWLPMIIFTSGIGTLCVQHGPVLCHSTAREVCVIERVQLPWESKPNWHVVTQGNVGLVIPLFEHVHRVDVRDRTVPVRTTVVTADGIAVRLHQGQLKISIRPADVVSALRGLGPSANAPTDVAKHLAALQFSGLFAQQSLVDVMDAERVQQVLQRGMTALHASLAKIHIDAETTRFPRLDFGAGVSRAVARFQTAEDKANAIRAAHQQAQLVAKQAHAELKADRAQRLHALDTLYAPKLQAARSAQQDGRLTANLAYQARLDAAKTNRETAHIREDAARYHITKSAAALADRAAVHHALPPAYMNRIVVESLFPQLSDQPEKQTLRDDKVNRSDRP
ncbi:MAG: SPFH domain-containing protein [Myxococcota bacterium]|nr:SPFH domain-containing protein [Myxococcota bacterium]